MIKTLNANITLLSSTSKTVCPVQICYDDSEDSADSDVKISLTYNNTQYQGIGNDYLWVDAFADLQNKLPDNIKLACCMTCRHGNMCPYGNAENQLFCTKDLRFSDKRDLCDLFDQTDPFEKRSVASIDFCDDFVYQSDDFYTYNDYLYLLRGDAGKTD